MNASVVIVYPTERDGSIVRWYVNEAQVHFGYEIASASPVRVCLEGASEQVAAEAYAVHRAMREDRHADVSWAATHRRVVTGLDVELVPLDRPAREQSDVSSCLTAAELARFALEILGDGHLCAFWACNGPDDEPVDMLTCGTCRTIHELRKVAAVAYA